MSAATVTSIRAADPTAAERQRRRRDRKKQAAVGVVTRDIIAPTVTLLAGLALATVSGTFSVIGLTCIFAGAFWPIIGMGAALEFGKVAAVTWLGRRYAAPLAIKTVIITLVAALMVINAIGAYGYLAASHIGHAVAGEVAIAARAADVDARQQVQAAILADIDRRIGQIDGAVGEAIRRGRTAAAMALVAEQSTRRDDLVAARVRTSNALAGLQMEAAAVHGDRAKIAADGGPIHYLAGLLGADDEAVMRFFILVVAGLLDPLAVVLLLGATAARRPAA
jgi:hypothetical protein